MINEDQQHADGRIQADDDPDGPETVRADFTATAAAVGVYFTFMLLVAFAPLFLAKPIDGHSISIGLGFGIFVILFLVAAAALYTRQRNRAARNLRVGAAR